MNTVSVMSIIMTVLLTGAATGAKQVDPKGKDKLRPITLKETELSGEIGRRIHDLIYKNYMVLDLGHDFIEPFQW